VLHRDIKPENILLDRTGTPKLADFGIAKLAGDPAAATGLTATGATLGTAAYMAPEQIEKPATVDHRADIYSLGVVLYEMLTGELPLGRFAAPSEKSGVNRGIDEVVLRALEKERSRRQQSATEMKTEVEDARAGMHRPMPARAPEKTPPTDLWTRVSFVLSTLTTLCAVGMVVSPMLGWKALRPMQMLAFVIIFGALGGVVKSFTPQTGPPKPPSPPREKDTGMAYLFWFLFGLVGGHRFYLGQVGWGLLYMVTGGLFFVGWIVDLFTLPAQVRATNEALRRGGLTGQPFQPAGPANPWPGRAAPFVAAVVIGLIVAGTWVLIPWKGGKWTHSEKDGSWSYQFGDQNGSSSGQIHFNSGGLKFNITPNTPAPSAPLPDGAAPKSDPASSQTKPGATPPDAGHAKATPAPKPE
jgi:TM2 domain-containing membrane protein YozV